MFENPEKVENVGLVGKVVETKETTASEVVAGPKVLFHVVNMEQTILLCALSFIFGGTFGSWIVMLWGIVK